MQTKNAFSSRQTGVSLKLQFFKQEVPSGLKKFFLGLPLRMLTDCGNSSSTGEFSDLFERKKFVNKRFKKFPFENQLLVTNKQLEFEATSLDPQGN